MGVPSVVPLQWVGRSVGSAGERVHAVAVAHHALDGAAVRRAALGLLPRLGAIARRPLGLAADPQADLGRLRLPLLGGIAGKEALLGKHVPLAHQLSVDVGIAR